MDIFFKYECQIYSMRKQGTAFPASLFFIGRSGALSVASPHRPKAGGGLSTAIANAGYAYSNDDLPESATIRIKRLLLILILKSCQALCCHRRQPASINIFTAYLLQCSRIVYISTLFLKQHL